MSKIGVKNIRFAHKGMIADSFFDKTGSYNMQNIYSKFSEIAFVQDTAVLSDDTVVDDNGLYHNIALDFAIRSDYVQNNNILTKFLDVPIIVMVKAVDGNNYVIGNNQSPAYIRKKSSYNALSLREHQVSLEYISIDGLQVVDTDETIPETPSIVLSQETVLVPSDGGSGMILVESQEEWTVEVTN